MELSSAQAVLPPRSASALGRRAQPHSAFPAREPRDETGQLLLLCFLSAAPGKTQEEKEGFCTAPLLKEVGTALIAQFEDFIQIIAVLFFDFLITFLLGSL